MGSREVRGATPRLSPLSSERCFSVPNYQLHREVFEDSKGWGHRTEETWDLASSSGGQLSELFNMQHIHFITFSYWHTGAVPAFSQNIGQRKRKKRAEGIPWQSSGEDSVLPLLEAQVQSLVGELRLHKPCVKAKKEKKQMWLGNCLACYFAELFFNIRWWCKWWCPLKADNCSLKFHYYQACSQRFCHHIFEQVN